jgi:hypothetical protein
MYFGGKAFPVIARSAATKQSPSSVALDGDCFVGFASSQ